MNEIEEQIFDAVQKGYLRKEHAFFLTQEVGPLVVKIKLIEPYNFPSYQVVEMMGLCMKLDKVLLEIKGETKHVPPKLVSA